MSDDEGGEDATPPGITNPKRKLGAPNTPAGPRAPGRNRAATTGHKKRPEPTLLGDFLLGRPSPNRPKNVVPNLQIPGLGLGRRKSLEDVKRGLRQGMNEDNMRRVKQPGKVQVRVMQWQRENAKAADDGIPKDEVIVVEVEKESGEEGVRMRGGKRPGRRKDLDDNEDGGVKLDDIPAKNNETPNAKGTPTRKATLKPTTPRKRVISDDHWMKGKKKSPPRSAPQKIPKNFLQATARNPPLETKIKDWVNRTEPPDIKEKPRNTPKKRDPEEEDTPEKKPASRKGNRQELGDDGIRIKPSKDRPYDDGIRVTPTPSNAASYDDGIRVTPSKVGSYDDGIRVRASKSPSVDEIPAKNHKNRKASRQEHFNDGIRIKPSNDKASDNGIRVASPSSKVSSDSSKLRREASKDIIQDASASTTHSKASPYNDGIRVTLSNDSLPDGGVRIKTPKGQSKGPKTNTTPKGPDSDIHIQRNADRNTPKQHKDAETPRKSSERRLKPPAEFKIKSRSSSNGRNHKEEDDSISNITPSPAENPKRRRRKSDTSQKSLDDIPFGNSAFSVLDLPVGAEAGTMKRQPPPKRNPSFAAVPKALKRVYNEGLKIVHDTAEPPRGGPNQPPSIETWLNGTTDPFVEQPAATVISEESLEVPQSTPSRRKSYKEDDQSEIALTAEHNVKRDSGRKATKKPIDDQEPDENRTPKANKRSSLPKLESSPLITPLMSPTGLKRTPATRNTSSPKAGRKLPFKEAIFDAFKGESGMKGKKDSPSPFDFIGLRERDVNHNEPEPPRDH